MHTKVKRLLIDYPPKAWLPAVGLLALFIFTVIMTDSGWFLLFLLAAALYVSVGALGTILIYKGNSMRDKSRGGRRLLWAAVAILGWLILVSTVMLGLIAHPNP